MKIYNTLAINVVMLLCGATFGSAQTWMPLANTYPGTGAGPCLVLTDGTVACNNSQSNSNTWYRRTPDATGSYHNGTWSAMPDMPYQPIYYASAVLKDGTLVIQGGEYLDHKHTRTNQGAYFDGTSWHSLTCNVVASGQLGDTPSVIFPDGTFMIANITNSNLAELPATTNAASLGVCAPANTCYS